VALKNNNYKYELDTKEFKFEMVTTYGTIYYTTNGVSSYKISKTKPHFFKRNIKYHLMNLEMKNMNIVKMMINTNN
jgi:hypothetical protein